MIYCTRKFKFALYFSHRTHLDSLWVRVQLCGVRVRVRVHKTRVQVHSTWVRVHRGGVRVRVRVHKGRVQVRTRVRTRTRTHPLSPSPSPDSLQHWIMCSLMNGQKSFTIFVLEILLKYQVTNWWLKNLLLWSYKEADFFPEINKSFTFPWMGLIRIKPFPKFRLKLCDWSKVTFLDWNYYNMCTSLFTINFLSYRCAWWSRPDFDAQFVINSNYLHIPAVCHRHAWFRGLSKIHSYMLGLSRPYEVVRYLS